MTQRNGFDQRFVAAVTVTGAVAVLVADLAMPWATFEDLATGATIEFQGGLLGILVTVLAVAVIGIALVQIRRPSLGAAIAQAAAALVLLMAAIVLALSTIADANRTVSLAPSETGYGIGSAVGLIGALVVLAASLLALLSRSDLRPAA